MGQYHLTVNLDKREFLDPHKLGDGLELIEQAGSGFGTAAALMVLLACSGYNRSSGDVHPEKLVRHGTQWVPVEVRDPEWEAHVRTFVGRWAGDRIAVVGDHARDSDLPAEFEASKVYQACRNGQYRDITDDVLPILEAFLGMRVERTNGRRKREEFLRPPRPGDPTSVLDFQLQQIVETAAKVLEMSVADTYRFLILSALKGLGLALSLGLVPRP